MKTKFEEVNKDAQKLFDELMRIRNIEYKSKLRRSIIKQEKLDTQIIQLCLSILYLDKKEKE